LTQLETTAHTLPGIVHAIGQPDLHPGTKFPIGAVFASKKWIHPPLVGSDIGCGMALYKTTLHRSQVDGDKGKRVAEQLRGLEGAWRTQAYREEWLLDEEKHSSSAGEQWDASLGTIGAGNHFAEIQVVEELPVTSNWDGRLRENDVVLLVHSGSRGFGGSIFKKHTANTHTSHEECSEDAVEYLKKHDKACEWAKANRDLIALRFLACLEPGNEDWKLGKSDASDADKEGIEMIMAAKEALKDRKMVDICHNNVERVAWPPSSPHLAADDSALDSSLIVATESLKLSDGIPQEYVYLHRKGAAPTHDPDTELPLDILPLPGSRGTPTLMLQPTFSDANSWGLKNGLSLAHGAGRAMSRAKALAMLSHKYKGINLLEPNSADPEGTWVICDEKDLVFEEAPWAYKVVQDVGRDLEDVGAARIVGWCCPRISYKIRNETR
jgi:RNA-splicing ligase RtcB